MWHVNNMNNFNQWFGNWGPWNTAGLGLGMIGVSIAIVFLAVLVALKGYALWTAARENQKWWFIALLVINTLGILELIYLIFVAKKFFHSSKSDSPVV